MARSTRHGVARRLTPALAAIVVVTAATTAGAASATAPTPTPAGGGGGTAFASALAELPATMLSADGAVLYYTDRALGWERLGVGRDTAERLDAIGRTFEVATYSQPPVLFAPRPRSRPQSRGDRFHRARHRARGVRARATAAGRRRRHDGHARRRSHRAHDRPGVVRRADRGRRCDGAFYSWGGDDTEVHVDRRSPLRPLGQSGHLAVGGTDQATVVQTLTADDMQAALAAADGSAAERARHRSVRRGDAMLDDADGTVLQAIGVPGTTLFMPPLDASADTIEQLLASLPQLVPYVSILVVEVVDPDGNPRTEIEVTHSDDASAAANAEAMAAWLADGTDSVSGRPLAELLPGATVEAVGPVIRVVVDGPGHYPTATDMLLNRALFPV